MLRILFGCCRGQQGFLRCAVKQGAYFSRSSQSLCNMTRVSRSTSPDAQEGLAGQTDLFEHRRWTLSREFEIGHGSHRWNASEGQIALRVPNFLASWIEPRLL